MNNGTDSQRYDPRYLEGIRWFNQGEFFEAHESWEELWLEVQGPARRFYQGLIQVAVCLHHFGNGNTRGARKLYHSSTGYLQDYRPRYLGLDLERLCADLAVCCREILDSDEHFPQGTLDPRLVPKLYLEGPAAGG
jgi:predicted metal-dependent hydrolase